MVRHPRGCRAVDPGRQRRALERWRVVGPVLLVQLVVLQQAHQVLHAMHRAQPLQVQLQVAHPSAGLRKRLLLARRKG